MRSTISLLFLLVSSLVICAQDVSLENASFEGTPRHSSVPKGWKNFGFPNESLPDLLPSKIFLVTKPPFDGRSYLGMVVRDNHTWESVMGTLDGVLQKEQCYHFSVALSKSNDYRSISRMTAQPVSFSTPCVLKIWGVDAQQKTKELLLTSEPIEHEEWEVYNFDIKPQTIDVHHIILEVFYDVKKEGFSFYNGNVLIDQMSAFSEKESCNTKEEELSLSLSAKYSQETLANDLLKTICDTRSSDEKIDAALVELVSLLKGYELSKWILVKGKNIPKDEFSNIKARIKKLGFKKYFKIIRTLDLSQYNYVFLSQCGFFNSTIGLYY